MCSQGLFHFPWHGGATQEKETTRRNCARKTSPRICTNFRQEELFTGCLRIFSWKKNTSNSRGASIYIAEIIWMTLFSVTLDKFKINVYSHQLNPSYAHILTAESGAREQVMQHANAWCDMHMNGAWAIFQDHKLNQLLLRCLFCADFVWKLCGRSGIGVRTLGIDGIA